MVWYRHWLEMRGRAGLALLFIVLAGVLFAVTVTNSQVPPTRFPAAFAVLGAGIYPIWMAHSLAVQLLMMLVSLMSMGSGISSYPIRTGLYGGSGGAHSSAYFTLSLPVSRQRWYLTRFAAAILLATVGFCVSLLLNSAVLYCLRLPVPFAVMAASSTSGLLFAIPVIGAAGLLVMWLGPTWGASIAAFAGVFFINMQRFGPGMWAPGAISPSFVLLGMALTPLTGGIGLAFLKQREF